VGGRKPKGKSKEFGGVQDGQPPFRMDFSARLRWLFDQFETRVEAGAIAGVSPEHLPAYLAGRAQPRFEAIARLAAAKNVSLDWLATGSGSRFLTEVEPVGFVEVAIQPDAATRFGEGEEAPTSMPFSRAWLKSIVATPADKLRIFIHRGNSNEPVIVDGDLLLVDTSVTRIAGNGLYVFPLDGKHEAKFVETLVNRRVALKARNPTYHAQILSADEAGELQLLGRVCWRGGMV